MQEHSFASDNLHLVKKINEISLKATSLHQAYLTKKKELRFLQVEYKRQTEALEKLKKENKELKNQVNSSDDFQSSKKIVKIVSSKLKQAGETAEWKGIIEELIGEIDRCIELLKEY